MLSPSEGQVAYALLTRLPLESVSTLNLLFSYVSTFLTRHRFSPTACVSTFKWRHRFHRKHFLFMPLSSFAIKACVSTFFIERHRFSAKTRWRLTAFTVSYVYILPLVCVSTLINGVIGFLRKLDGAGYPAFIRNLVLTRLPVRLACVKHAASVRPEPGSNSPINLLKNRLALVI